MRRINIEIYRGVIIPIAPFDQNQSKVLFEELIGDLCSSDIKFPLGDELEVNVKVKRLKALDAEKKKRWIQYKTYGVKEVILKFYATIEYSDKHFPIDAHNTRGYWEYDLIHRFERRFYDFTVSLDISRSGAFHGGVGLMYANKKFISPLKDITIYPYEILDYAIEKKWPVFESLDILKTWDWYVNKVFPNNSDGVSSSSLGRAMNAFTHLYNKEADQNEYLFWSMVGIEALYVKGREGIGEQVRDKVQIFLGEIKEFKKRLTLMYAYRSAFVHGSKDFPGLFHLMGDEERYQKYADESYNTVHVAKSVLLATLQKMAKHNLAELDFKYVLSTNKE